MVPFKDHLYVPEVHPVTGMQFCEREDEGHVFKVHVHCMKLSIMVLSISVAVSMCIY